MACSFKPFIVYLVKPVMFSFQVILPEGNSEDSVMIDDRIIVA